MKTLTKVVLACVFLALGVWLWSVFFPAPEKIIRKNLDEVARCASFTGNENPFTALGNAQRLAGLFSTNTEVNINVPGPAPHSLVGREEITQVALAARSSATGLKVQFLDVNVVVSPDRQSATADLTLKAGVPGEPDFVVQEMKFTLRLISGEWLITRVETVRTLS